MYVYRQVYIYTHTYIPTYMHRYRQTDRQTERQTVIQADMSAFAVIRNGGNKGGAREGERVTMVTRQWR